MHIGTYNITLSTCVLSLICYCIPLFTHILFLISSLVIICSFIQISEIDQLVSLYLCMYVSMQIVTLLLLLFFFFFVEPIIFVFLYYCFCNFFCCCFVKDFSSLSPSSFYYVHLIYWIASSLFSFAEIIVKFGSLK